MHHNPERTLASHRGPNRVTHEPPKKDDFAQPAEPAKYIWMSGKMVDWNKALIHATMLGWSSISMVFEGIRGYWNADEEQLSVFHLDAHLTRLMRSMKVMRMTSPWSVDELRSAIVRLVSSNEFTGDCYIQPIAYFGDGTPGYLPASGRPGEISIFSRKSSSVLGEGSTITCGVSSWTRISDNVMPPRVKAIANYQNSRYVADEVSLNGHDFGIILNQQGKVSEVSYACIFIVRDGVAITPPLTAGILESITRDVVIELLRDELGVPVVEREADRTELYIADEAFICGTGAESQAISEIDRYQIGDGGIGTVVTRLEQHFHDVVRGRVGDRSDWLTGVY